jgi:hypothetical protein
MCASQLIHRERIATDIYNSLFVSALAPFLINFASGHTWFCPAKHFFPWQLPRYLIQLPAAWLKQAHHC